MKTWWPFRSSIRWRLTAWYSGMLALLLGIFVAGSLIVLERVLAARHDRFLDEARGAYIAELVVEYDELGTTRAASVAAVRDTRFNETWVFVVNAAGELLARADASGERGARITPMPQATSDSIARLTASVPDQHSFHSIEANEAEFRIALGPTMVGGERLWVATAQSRDAMLETVEQVATGYLVVAPLLLLLAALGGYFLARRALAPMAQMAERARTIGATNLNERLHAPQPDDEVGELAGVINDLLARLDRSFALQRRFVADASHELRTPVATVCAEADVTLTAASRSEPEYRESLTVVRQAGRRLSRVVDELFLLARIDAGHLPIAQEPFYLNELVDDVARSMRALAQTRSVTVCVEPSSDTPLVGDPRLVERLVLNLLDNAVRYSPAGGSVAVRLGQTGNAASVVVADHGPGVPPEARERIFERFFRVEASRAHTGESFTGGAGLGLSIARWIAEAHRGTLVHRDPSGKGNGGNAGSEFVVTLPLQHH